MITLFFYIRIYFIRISRLKFAKVEEYFKNKAEAEAEILKRIDIILCLKTSVNTIPFYVFNLRWPNTVLARAFADAN